MFRQAVAGGIVGELGFAAVGEYDGFGGAYDSLADRYRGVDAE